MPAFLRAEKNKKTITLGEFRVWFMSSWGLHLWKPPWRSIWVQFEVHKEAEKGTNTKHRSYSPSSRVILLFSRQRKTFMAHRCYLALHLGKHSPFTAANGNIIDQNAQLRRLYWENSFSSLSWRSKKALKDYQPSTVLTNHTASFPSPRSIWAEAELFRSHQNIFLLRTSSVWT